MAETQTLTLTEFLLARIAEDEARWRMLGTVESMSATADFLLADCKAKRRIVERHYTTGDDAMDSGLCGEDDFNAPCPTLRILATIHADHPDYRDEWRA